MRRLPEPNESEKRFASYSALKNTFNTHHAISLDQLEKWGKELVSDELWNKAKLSPEYYNRRGENTEAYDRMKAGLRNLEDEKERKNFAEKMNFSAVQVNGLRKVLGKVTQDKIISRKDMFAINNNFKTANPVHLEYAELNQKLYEVDPQIPYSDAEKWLTALSEKAFDQTNMEPYLKYALKLQNPKISKEQQETRTAYMQLNDGLVISNLIITCAHLCLAQTADGFDARSRFQEITGLPKHTVPSTIHQLSDLAKTQCILRSDPESFKPNLKEHLNTSKVNLEKSGDLFDSDGNLKGIRPPPHSPRPNP